MVVPFLATDCVTLTSVVVVLIKLGFYVPSNSQGHIGTGSQHCNLWDSNHTEMTAYD